MEPPFNNVWKPTLLWLLALLAGGCELATPTQIFVHADADTQTRARAAFLRATITSQEGEVRLRHEFPLRADGAHEWPIELSVLPLNGDASRTVTVQLEALDPALQTFNERTGRYSFIPNELFEATLFLQDACIGVVCEEGATCDQGVCVPVESVVPITRDPDLQRGVCHQGTCWEHPRPAGGNAPAVCAHAEGGAIALAGTVAWLDENGWTPDAPWEDDAVVDLACWSDREAVAISRRRVAVRDAAGWTTLDEPPSRGLLAMWARSPDDIWVVGARGVVQRYRDGRWATPTGLGPLDVDLSFVDGNADEVWIVGEGVFIRYPLEGSSAEVLDDRPVVDGAPVPSASDYIERGTQRALIHGTDLYVYEGGAWQDVHRGQFGFLSLAFSDSRLYAGGPRGTLEWLDRASVWHRAPPFRGAAIDDIAVSNDALFAVGDNATIGVLRRDRWTDTGVSLSVAELLSVASGDGSVVAVGREGLILQRVDQAIWRRRVALEGDEVIRQALHDVVHDGSSWWAVGEGGAVVRSSDGIRWVSEAVPLAASWRALCARGGQLLVIGEAGRALRRADGVWSEVAFPSAVELRTCAGSDPWLVGDGEGNVYNVQGDRATLRQRHAGPITQIVAADSFTAVLANGEFLRTRADGTCDAPCADEDAPAGVLEVVLDGNTPRWWRDRFGVSSAEGISFRHPLNRMVAHGEGVIAVGTRSAVVRIGP